MNWSFNKRPSGRYRLNPSICRLKRHQVQREKASKTTTFVIIVIIIIMSSLCNEITTCSSHANKSSPIIYNQTLTQLQQPQKQQQRQNLIKANIKGATNQTDDMNEALNLTSKIFQSSRSSRDKGAKGMDAMIDDCIMREDFGQLISLGFNHLVGMFFSEQEPRDPIKQLDTHHTQWLSPEVIRDFKSFRDHLFEPTVKQDPRSRLARPKRDLQAAEATSGDISTSASSNTKTSDRPAARSTSEVPQNHKAEVAQASASSPKLIKSVVNPASKARSTQYSMKLVNDGDDDDSSLNDPDADLYDDIDRTTERTGTNTNSTRAVTKLNKQPTGSSTRRRNHLSAPLQQAASTYAPASGGTTESAIESPLVGELGIGELMSIDGQPQTQNVVALLEDGSMQTANGTRLDQQNSGQVTVEPITEPEESASSGLRVARRGLAHDQSQRATGRQNIIPSPEHSPSKSAPVSAAYKSQQTDERDEDPEAEQAERRQRQAQQQQITMDAQQPEPVPQVGDPSVLDSTSGSVPTQRQVGAGSTAGTGQSLMDLKAKELERLLRAYEMQQNNIYSLEGRARAKNSKRPGGQSGRLATQVKPSTATGSFAKASVSNNINGLGQMQQPAVDSVDDQNQPAQRTNAPYAAHDPVGGIATGGRPPMDMATSQQKHSARHNGNHNEPSAASSLHSMAPPQVVQASSGPMIGQQQGGYSPQLEYAIQAQNRFGQLGPPARMAARQWLVEQPAASSQLQQDFFNSNPRASIGSFPNGVRHNKRAALTNHLIDSQQQQQFSPQILSYKDLTRPLVAGDNNNQFRGELAQHTESLGQQFINRPPVGNRHRPNDYRETNGQVDTSGQLLNAQGQVLGLVRAGPQILSQASGNTALLRRQAPLGANQPAYSMAATYRLPTLPVSTYVLPATFSTMSNAPQNVPPAPRFSRALSNNNNNNYGNLNLGNGLYGLSQLNGNNQPQRNMNSATAYQHRIGRVAQSSNANYDETGAQASAPHTSTQDPAWSDAQRGEEDDYQSAPQTIQITAVPGGGFAGLNNGFGGFNGFNGLNALNGLNAWNGPWGPGRQVLLVNRQPQVGSEWRSWMLPVAIILALPLILGALFVPVFLKSVMFLIQILQMLGLLMPPSQLAAHLTSGSHGQQSG